MDEFEGDFEAVGDRGGVKAVAVEFEDGAAVVGAGDAGLGLLEGGFGGVGGAGGNGVVILRGWGVVFGDEAIDRGFKVRFFDGFAE